MAMKTLFKPLGLLCFAALIISCSKEETPITPDPEIINSFADFEYVKGDDPFTYEFKSLSSKFKRLEWRFGDDTLATTETPSHVFLSTGTFTIDLRAISESGAVSRAVKEIKIKPDDILKMKGTRTATPNHVLFDVESLASFAAINWRLVDRFKPNAVTTTSKDLKPDFALTPGTLTEVNLEGTTVKGSKVTLTKFASPAGIVTDIRTLIVKTTASRDNTSNANETSAKLTDGIVDNKIFLGWSNGNNDTWQLKMDLESPQVVKYYGLRNGNDSPGRDPKSWKLEGSNDNGATWTLVDQRTLDKHFTQQLFDRGWKDTDADLDWKNFYFDIANPQSFKSYRLNITSNFGDGGMQFGEIMLFK